MKEKDSFLTIELGDNALKNPNLHLSKKSIADKVVRGEKQDEEEVE